MLSLPSNFYAPKLELNTPTKGIIVATGSNRPDTKASIERLNYSVKFVRFNGYRLNVAGHLQIFTLQADDMHRDKNGILWHKDGEWIFVPSMEPRTDAERLEQAAWTHKIN